MTQQEEINELTISEEQNDISYILSENNLSNNEINDLLNKIQVYVNCGGKTGSRTLLNTLDQYYKCLHCHGNFNFQNFILKNANINLYNCIKNSMEHYDDVYVIDSYRTPIERAISSSFENNPETTMENFNYKLLINENYDCFDETIFNLNLEKPKYFDFEKKYIVIRYKNLHIIKIRFADINDWDKILSKIFTPFYISNADFNSKKNKKV